MPEIVFDVDSACEKNALISSHFLFSSFSFRGTATTPCLSALSLSLAARDVIQQHAAGSCPVERRGVDDSAAESGGDDEEERSVLLAFGRRRHRRTILHRRCPLELRPARLFYPPCVSARPLSKRRAAKGKLARRGGEFCVAGMNTPTT